MRTTPTQLPSYQELCDILTHEASRPIPKEKEGAHYGDFTTILALLNTYNLPTNFFDKEIQFEKLGDQDAFRGITAMFDTLVDDILRTQDDPSKQILFNNLYDYLSESDPLENADVIFVFGSKSTFRVDKAITLYKEGRAPMILISGKGPFCERTKSVVPEAEILAKYAQEHGVPNGAIIIEKESITVPDNVKRSLNLLEKNSMPHDNIILVNSPFSQRRGWTHFSKMSHEGTRLIQNNTDTVSEEFSRSGWYRNETGAQVIVKEFFGLRVSSILNTS
ncbi:MAG: YdcF family protein [Minisyncoccota bacterium]